MNRFTFSKTKNIEIRISTRILIHLECSDLEATFRKPACITGVCGQGPVDNLCWPFLG